MISPVLTSILLGAMLIYGALESRRSRLVGAAIATVAAVTMVLTWLPETVAAIGTTLGLETPRDLVLFAWAVLLGLLLLNLHLKLRRQMELITALARRVALQTGSSVQARASDREPMGVIDSEPIAVLGGEPAVRP